MDQESSLDVTRLIETIGVLPVYLNNGIPYLDEISTQDFKLNL